MKKKIFSSMLLLAMVITTVGMFVSCKDYDDDINDLRNQISSNATDLQSLVTEQINTVNSQITQLQSQSTALQAAYEAADANLKSTLEVVITESISTSEAYADIQAAQAQAASIAAAQEMVDSAIATLQAALDEANANIAANGESIATLVAANTELASAIQAAQAKADEAYELAQNAYNLAQQAYDLAQSKADASDLASKADQADLDELSQNLSDLSEIVDEIYEFCAYDVQEAIYELMYEIYEVEYEAYINAAAIESLQAQLGDLSDSDMTVLEMIQELESSLNATNDGLVERCAIIQSQVNQNASDIAAQQADIEQLKADVDAAVVAAEQYADMIAAQAAENLAEEVDGIYVSLDKLTDAYQKADEALQDQIDQLKSDLQEKITTLKNELSDAIGDTADELQEQIDDINEALNLLTNVDDFSQLSDLVASQGESIEELQAKVLELNEYLIYESKRLKSLVFAPTTYVDGIEAICFATLKYEDWGTKWLYDAPQTNNMYRIDDANHTEEYLVNPKNINMDDIEELSYISNTATNTFTTRSVSQSAPIAVAGSELDKSTGVLKLKLTKTDNTDDFGTDGSKFTIVSLKAKLSDKLLTDEEKESGEEVAIYSDWARLYETSVTPYIHSAILNGGVDSNNKLIENGDESHFHKFTEMYPDNSTSKTIAYSYADKYIATEVYYKDAIDLRTLVMVCDKDGNSYDMGSYGLSWEFHIMDYNLANDNEATDATNQAKFAKLADDGYTLYSTARDNETTQNRDAISKTPVIQVVLKDDNNGTVVDVRYLKIEWVDEIVVDYYGELELDKPTVTYACGEEIENLILEEQLNKVYTKYDLTRDEFHAAYTLSPNLYASQTEAEKGSDGTVVAKLGTLEDLEDMGQKGETHNIQWTVNFSDYKATQNDYNNGSMTITAYGYFQSTTNEKSRIVFKVTLTVEIPQMSLAYNHFESMWDESGARNINPQLETDATYGNSVKSTTMMLGDLLVGYMLNSSTPSDIVSIVNNAEEAYFVFDDSKLSNIATATGTSTSDWKVSSDGLTLTYKNVTAATITADDADNGIRGGAIQLYEDGDGSSTSTPSDGAKLLIGNYTPVKLISSYCDLNDEIESYNVNYLVPLALRNNTITVSLKDITSGGSVSESIYGTIEIYEYAVENHRTVFINNASDVKDATIINDPYYGSITQTAYEAILMPWYGVETPVFDIDNAKTNLNGNGGYDSTCKTLLSSLVKDNDPDQPLYKIAVDNTNWTVTFTNVYGNSVGKNFKIEIPISIKTKWQDNLAATLVVTVEPGSAVN